MLGDAKVEPSSDFTERTTVSWLTHVMMLPTAAFTSDGSKALDALSLLMAMSTVAATVVAVRGAAVVDGCGAVAMVTPAFPPRPAPPPALAEADAAVVVVAWPSF